MSSRIAVYVGSFDPFHIGHKYVAETAAAIFDKVVVCVAVNPEKEEVMRSPMARVADIKHILSGTGNIEVSCMSGMAVDIARRFGASFIVKGVRNGKDFEDEMAQSDANMHLAGIKTVLIPSPPEYAFVSSTMIRGIAKIENSERYIRQLMGGKE